MDYLQWRHVFKIDPAKEISDEILTIKDFVEELNRKKIGKIEFDKTMGQMLMYFDVVSTNVK